MSDKPLKITFHLDGTGVAWDAHEPTHLDSLLGWCLSPYHVTGEPPRRDEEPDDIPLPLRRWHIGGTWGWHASALFPDGGQTETRQYWRSRFRDNRIEFTAGSPNHINGPYRDWQMPMALILCPRMVAYAHGDRSDVHKLLRRHIRYVGKKTAMGKGRVLGVDVEWIDENLSLIQDGRVMRWLPHPAGTRLIRPRPPYWNNCGRVQCREVGDAN